MFQQILQEKQVLDSLSNNTWVLVTATIVANAGKFSVNEQLYMELVTELQEFIEELPTSKITVVARAEKEQFCQPVPTALHLKRLTNNENKQFQVFYQHPWPAKVPNFLEEDNTVLRFTYDEGCDLDRMCARENDFEYIGPNQQISMLVSREEVRIIHKRDYNA